MWHKHKSAEEAILKKKKKTSNIFGKKEKMNFEARQGMHACNLSKWEAEAEGFQFKTSPDNIVNFFLKKQNKTKF